MSDVPPVDPAATDASADSRVESLVGAHIGRYTLERVLGHGGMGAVYEARSDDGASYALKVIRPEMHEKRGADAIRRFLREGKAAEEIASPHVARVLDVGNDEARGLPFLVMELLRGRDLGRLLEETGPLEPDGVVALFVQACAGLAAAHERGVIHRDIKPANIFVQDLPDGVVAAKICDFGVAKQTDPHEPASALTQSGGVVGSPMYMSPEQARGAKRVDHRTDVFSLGVSLYEALTGVRPWQASSVGQIVFAMHASEPRPLAVLAPWVDPALAAVIHRTLARDPEQRPPTASAFGEALAPFGTNKLTLASLRGVSAERRAQLAKSATMTWSDAALASTIPTSSGAIPARTDGEPKPTGRGRARWLWPLVLLAGAAGGAAWYAHERTPVKWWTAARLTLAIPIPKSMPAFDDACPVWLSRALAEGTSADILAGGQVRVLDPQALAQIFGPGQFPTTGLNDDFGVDGVVNIECRRSGDDAKVSVRVVEAGDRSREVASFRVSGAMGSPSALVARATAKLRSVLGLPAATGDELAHAAHPLPATADATRDYMTGLDRLDLSDPAGARDPLARAVAADPSFAPAHQALSAALAATGVGADALREADLAAKTASSLPNEDRLVVEGEAAEGSFRWGSAIDTYRAIIRVFPDRTDIAIRLVRALIRVGRYRDVRESLDALLAVAPAASRDPRVELAQAEAEEASGTPAKAVELASRVRACAHAAGMKEIEVVAAESECNARDHLSDPAATDAVCADALALVEKSGDHQMLLRHLSRNTYMEMIRGDLTAANRSLDRAIALADVEHNQRFRATTLNLRANIAKHRGDLPAAIAAARAAVVAADASGDNYARGSARLVLAGALLDSGVVDEARTIYEETVALARASGLDETRAIALQNLGELWTTKGDITQAAASANEALALQEQMGEELDLPWTLDELGAIEIAAGEPEKARAHFEKAIELRTKQKVPVAGSRADLAQALLDLGDLAGAWREASAAVEEADRGEAGQTKVAVRLPLARVLIAQGKAGEALGVIDRARELAEPGKLSVEELMPVRVEALLGAGRLTDAVAASKAVVTTVSARREMRLVEDEIAIRQGRTDAAVRDLEALAREAHAAGDGRIERKVSLRVAGTVRAER